MTVFKVILRRYIPLCGYLWVLTCNTFLDILVPEQNKSPYHSAFFSSRIPLTLFRLNPALDRTSSARMTAGCREKWLQCRARWLSETVTINAPNPINLWAEIEFPEQHGACGKTVDCGRRWSLPLTDFQTNIVGRLRVVLSMGQTVWPLLSGRACGWPLASGWQHVCKEETHNMSKTSKLPLSYSVCVSKSLCSAAAGKSLFFYKKSNERFSSTWSSVVTELQAYFTKPQVKRCLLHLAHTLLE